MAYPISDVTRRVVYSGSAGVGPYSFSFEVLANTDIAVYKNTTLLTLTTDYTVTINSNGTGSVTLVSAATGSDSITLVGDRSIERATDFVTGGDLFANSLNDEFDSLVIFSQQIDEKVARSLIAPVTDPTSIDMSLPIYTARANKYLKFDNNGDPIVSDFVESTIYLGASATNPTTRLNGSALQTGDFYFNTSTKMTLYYSTDTSSWYDGSTSEVKAVAALNVDCSTGNYFTKTISGNSTFTFSNAPSSRAYSFVLKVVNTSGTMTWPAAVKWVNDTLPDFTTGKTHLIMFSTDDGGTVWRASALPNFTA
jgi:hypothetical protein